MTSALTNSDTARVSRKRAGAAVDFPAPFGPPIITTLGFEHFTPGESPEPVDLEQASEPVFGASPRRSKSLKRAKGRDPGL
jgi:hypothetical protein